MAEIPIGFSPQSPDAPTAPVLSLGTSKQIAEQMSPGLGASGRYSEKVSIPTKTKEPNIIFFYEDVPSPASDVSPDHDWGAFLDYNPGIES